MLFTRGDVIRSGSNDAYSVNRNRGWCQPGPGSRAVLGASHAHRDSASRHSEAFAVSRTRDRAHGGHAACPRSRGCGGLARRRLGSTHLEGDEHDAQQGPPVRTRPGAGKSAKIPTRDTGPSAQGVSDETPPPPPGRAVTPATPVSHRRGRDRSAPKPPGLPRDSCVGRRRIWTLGQFHQISLDWASVYQ